jgi:hypothetical protein
MARYRKVSEETKTLLALLDMSIPLERDEAVMILRSQKHDCGSYIYTLKYIAAILGITKYEAEYSYRRYRNKHKQHIRSHVSLETVLLPEGSLGGKIWFDKPIKPSAKGRSRESMAKRCTCYNCPREKECRAAVARFDGTFIGCEVALVGRDDVALYTKEAVDEEQESMGSN